MGVVGSTLLLGRPSGSGDGRGQWCWHLHHPAESLQHSNWWSTLHWGGSQERDEHPWLVTFVLTGHKEATINRVSSFVIFDSIFLLAVRQFSTPEAANSQFWLCSCTHKLCPCTTMLPQPEDAVSSLQILSCRGQFWWIICWSNWQGRGFWFSLWFLFGSSLVPLQFLFSYSSVPLWFLFGSFEYVQFCWSTLIGSNFKKKQWNFFHFI